MWKRQIEQSGKTIHNLTDIYLPPNSTVCGGPHVFLTWLVMSQSLLHVNILTLSMCKLALTVTYLHSGWFGDIAPVSEASSAPRTDNNASH